MNSDYQDLFDKLHQTYIYISLFLTNNDINSEVNTNLKDILKSIQNISHMHYHKKIDSSANKKRRLL